MHKAMAGIALAWLFAGAGAVQADETSNLSGNTTIATASEAEMRKNGSPSIQVAVARHGTIVYSGAFGTADLEQGTPATPTTRYRTASVAKWFTAVEAMRLAEAGKLDLDAPVQTYCPQFPVKPSPVTVRELLSHTSGIRHDADYDTLMASAKNDTERLAIERRRTREDIGRFTRYDTVAAPLVNFQDDDLLFTPGTKWSYSSPDYRLLSCVIEGAGGRPFAQMMEQDIFKPAGMAHTVPDDSWAIVPERAGLYQLVNAQLELRRANYRDVSENLAAGGYLSTASDMLGFAMRFVAGDLLSSTGRSAMLEPVLFPGVTPKPVGPDLPPEVPSYGRYGLGVMMFPAEEGLWFGHSGRQDGASSILVVSPDGKCIVAAMMNIRSWAGSFAFARHICEIAGS